MSTSVQEVRRRLEQNWIAFAKQNKEKLPPGKIDGSSPPSVFVGRFGYPKVNVGPMIPLMHGDTSIMDNAELWAGRSIQEIAEYRIALVRCTSRVRISETSGRYIMTLQELALSRKPVESEASLEKPHSGGLEFRTELTLSDNVPPFGPAARINDLKIRSASSDKKLEYAYYDTDLKASDALKMLYQNGVPIGSIQRVLSMGMLGLDKSRKLVPTRWSITATDDVISKHLIGEVNDFPSLDSFQVTKYAHMGNRYSVILIPDSTWRFEMIEAWHTGLSQISIGTDFEDHKGLNHYPTIAGAYFAGRLAVAEFLNRVRRKCSCLLLREIRPEYVIPLGVWQIRVGVRSALAGKPIVFDSLEGAISSAFAELSISPSDVLRKSRLFVALKHQKKITDFG